MVVEIPILGTGLCNLSIVLRSETFVQFEVVEFRFYILLLPSYVFTFFGYFSFNNTNSETVYFVVLLQRYVLKYIVSNI